MAADASQEKLTRAERAAGGDTILSIGRTHYYVVRKGPHHYRIAEGKRLNDPDHCWQVLKEPMTGKSYYVNYRGVRRWHLPDIYLTEEERMEEQRQLSVRKQRKANEEQHEGAVAAEGEGAVIDEEARLVALFGPDPTARDRAAVDLKPNREWDNADLKRQVLRYAKSVLSPHQFQLDTDLFSQIVHTCTREFFSRETKFGEAEKARLKASLITFAKERREHQDMAVEYRHLNVELTSKVKRLDAERRDALSKLDVLHKNEDKLKDEVFRLRAHKQDAMLAGFKHLTRAGLIKTYWFRWKQFKDVLEAQLHIRARERRAMDMLTKNKSLEDEIKTLKDFIAKLQERCQQAEGRDVIAVILKQAGSQLSARYYAAWRRWSQDSKREKALTMAREHLINCPNCALRASDNARIRDRLDEAYKIYREKDLAFTLVDEERKRLEATGDEQGELTLRLSASVSELQALNSDISQKLQATSVKLWQSELLAQALQKEVERMQFEVMSLSNFGGGGGPRSLALDDAAAGMSHGYFGTRGGGVSPPPPGAAMTTGAYAGRIGAGPLGMDHFFAREAETAAKRLQSTMADHRGATKAVDGDGGRAAAGGGRVSAATSKALAPFIRHAITDPLTQEQLLDAAQREARHAAGEDVPPPPDEPRPDHLVYAPSETDDATDPEGTERSASLAHGGPRGTDDDALLRQGAEQSVRKLVDEGKCEKCGFRKQLTPFCPKDGLRHQFSTLAAAEGTGPRSHHRLPQESDFAITRGGDTGVLVHLPPGIPPPQYVASTGANGGGGIPQRLPSQLSQHTANLVASLNLDPKSYDSKRVGQLLTPMSAGGGPSRPPPHLDETDVLAAARYQQQTRMAVEEHRKDALRNAGINDKSYHAAVGAHRLAVNTSHGVPLTVRHYRAAGMAQPAVSTAGSADASSLASRLGMRGGTTGWSNVFDTSDVSSMDTGGSAFGFSLRDTSAFGVERAGSLDGGTNSRSGDDHHRSSSGPVAAGLKPDQLAKSSRLWKEQRSVPSFYESGGAIE